MTHPKVSLCLAIYNDPKSSHLISLSSKSMLHHFLDSLSQQSYKNYELIVSDHSSDNELYEPLIKFSESRSIFFRYFKFEQYRGSPEANMNNAIKNASGKFIKPFYPDDYFFDPYSLAEQVDKLESTGCNWVASSFAHISEANYSQIFNPRTPYLSDTLQLLQGINTLGSPVNIMFLNNQKIFFDENLIWLPDVELYYRLFLQYGSPGIVNKISFISRLRESGVTNSPIIQIVKSEEALYCTLKHTFPNYIREELFPGMLERLRSIGYVGFPVKYDY